MEEFGTLKVCPDSGGVIYEHAQVIVKTIKIKKSGDNFKNSFYAQNLILVNFFGFVVKRFCPVLEVSCLCRGPGRVGTGPGDVFTRVLTNFHRERAAGDRVMSQKLFKLTSVKLTSIKIRAQTVNLFLFSTCLQLLLLCSDKCSNRPDGIIEFCCKL